MPRRARVVIPNMPVHVIQRGHDKNPIFFCDDDYWRYLNDLKLAASKAGCSVHAYVLMTNHVHLVVTPHAEHALGEMMRSLGARYVRFINICYKRFQGARTFEVKGQRVIKRVQDGGKLAETHFHYNVSNQLIAETAGDGALVKDYLYMDSERLAVVDHNLSGELLFVHNDHLGSPQLMTDANQQTVWQVDRKPFGEVDTRVAKLDLTMGAGFPGQYADGATGYTYNYFRDYDASLGRYIQSDPIGLAGGVNTFGYVSGNPLVLVDYYGLSAWGLTCGASYTNKEGDTVGFTASLTLDSDGNMLALASTDIGSGPGKGFSGFFRGLLAPGSDVTNEDLVGSALSVSATGKGFSASITKSITMTNVNGATHIGTSTPIIEFGKGFGKGVNISHARGHNGASFSWNGLGNLGRSIGSNVYDFLH